ncbi:MAG: CpsD/CapB family tyrosine-protein kinase [Chloroflexota bacterium]
MPPQLPFRKTATAPEATSVSTFRNLYTRVLLGLQAQQHRVIGLTSAIDGEGKTTIASGLAAALAEDGALLGFGREPDTILLVECNMGSLPENPRLGIRPGPGLVQVLRGECELDAAIQTTGVERLSVLTLGEPAHNFPLAIRTATLPEVIAQLRSEFGLVVMDLPAVLNSSDTQVLARLADQIVLVVRAGVTPAKLVRQAVDELVDQLGEEMLLGVVLNDSRSDLPPWLDNRL